MTGSSSNTALVPNANIVFGGSGASRTVTVTPAANQNGTATISLSVSDGALSTIGSFVLTVIVDRTTSEDASTGAFAFTVGDVEDGSGGFDGGRNFFEYGARAQCEHCFRWERSEPDGDSDAGRRSERDRDDYRHGK